MVEGAGSDRPGLIVHVASQTLLEGLPGISETVNGTVLTADEIRRISCDANLSRVVFGPESQPLDVGRTKRLVTPAQRIAVMARDLNCVFPNCHHPDHWCDVHHIIHWADGGETDIDNLVLLCRHHHTLVHEAGWQLVGTPGNLSFLRPDGTELGDKPPPRPQYQSPIVSPERLEQVLLDFKKTQQMLSAARHSRGP